MSDKSYVTLTVKSKKLYYHVQLVGQAFALYSDEERRQNQPDANYFRYLKKLVSGKAKEMGMNNAQASRWSGNAISQVADLTLSQRTFGDEIELGITKWMLAGPVLMILPMRIELAGLCFADPVTAVADGRVRYSDRGLIVQSAVIPTIGELIPYSQVGTKLIALEFEGKDKAQ